MKLWNQVGRGRSPASAFTSSPPTSFHFLSLHPSPPARILRRQPILRHGSGEPNLQLSFPAVPLLPLLLHKITEAEERGGCYVAWCPACWPSQPAHLQRHPARPQAHALPVAATVSASRSGSSSAIGTIGKQRLKMNYPVSSSSLTNK